MNFKVILIIAVACTSCYCKKNQNMKDRGLQKVPKKFLKLYEKYDFWIGKNITLHRIGPYIKENNNRTVKCYLKHEANYTLTIRLFTVKLNEAARGIRKYFDADLGQFQQNYGKHGQKMQNAWMKIVEVMQEYPYQLKEFLKQKDFGSAYNYMEKAKNKVEFYDIMAEYLRRDIKTQMPKQSEKIKEQMKEMRQDIKNSTRAIGRRIEKCIKRVEN